MEEHAEDKCFWDIAENAFILHPHLMDNLTGCRILSWNFPPEFWRQAPLPSGIVLLWGNLKLFWFLMCWHMTSFFLSRNFLNYLFVHSVPNFHIAVTRGFLLIHSIGGSVSPFYLETHPWENFLNTFNGTFNGSFSFFLLLAILLFRCWTFWTGLLIFSSFSSFFASWLFVLSERFAQLHFPVLLLIFHTSVVLFWIF